MKTNGTRYSPAFKFQVVLEALKAEGKGAEAQVARAYGVHPVTLFVSGFSGKVAILLERAHSVGGHHPR
ncbi:MAG: hypothetical protein DRG83_15325 [Deltaproteobacteria bacterium]|nr:MAG: hypothetical protein DRG83_15325 [Deltaproteobacteria bacterium]